jgi:hypothetical protein
MRGRNPSRKKNKKKFIVLVPHLWEHGDTLVWRQHSYALVGRKYSNTLVRRKGCQPKSAFQDGYHLFHLLIAGSIQIYKSFQ